MRADPSALREAARAGRLDALRALLDAGERADAPGERDWTALHLAVLSGEADAAALLLERGADPNARGQFDLTPLHWAAMKGRADLAKLLVKRGARLEARDLWGRTPLHQAAEAKVVHALVDLGADVNAQDGRGFTPLHLARSEEVANALLEKKSDLRIRTRAGLTALELQVADEPLSRGLELVMGRTAGRLRGERAQMEVELRNLTDAPIAGIELGFESAACTAKPAAPRFDLAPGELVLLAVELSRAKDVGDGEQKMVGVLRLGGAEAARLDLVVDTSRHETPEDRGLIRLGTGSLHRAPGAWANVAFALAPLLLLAIWFGGRWWARRRQRG